MRRHGEITFHKGISGYLAMGLSTFQSQTESYTDIDKEFDLETTAALWYDL